MSVLSMLAMLLMTSSAMEVLIIEEPRPRTDQELLAEARTHDLLAVDKHYEDLSKQLKAKQLAQQMAKELRAQQIANEIKQLKAQQMARELQAQQMAKELQAQQMAEEAIAQQLAEAVVVQAVVDQYKQVAMLAQMAEAAQQAEIAAGKRPTVQIEEVREQKPQEQNRKPFRNAISKQAIAMPYIPEHARAAAVKTQNQGSFEFTDLGKAVTERYQETPTWMRRMYQKAMFNNGAQNTLIAPID